MPSLDNSKKLHAIYVCAGLRQEIGKIAQFTRANKILSFTERVEDAKLGLSITFQGTTEKLDIVVNQEAAQAEGADLDPRFLLLTRKI